MKKRATIVCASIGVAVVLSAANMTSAWDPDASFGASNARLLPASVYEMMGVAPDGRARPAVDTTGTHFDLLRAVYGPRHEGGHDPRASLPTIDTSTLWLARAIYSETKLPHEQELVAWVVRNRVETEYRGKDTYKEVVLDPYQFSAFNPGSGKRSFYMHLDPNTQLSGWQRALSIAHYVRHADPAYRPFSIKTRHFFSEISMPGHRFPYWVEHHNFVSPGWNYTVDQRRFRFYEKIS